MYTGGRDRTDTPIKERDFESRASANSATPAQYINKKLPPMEVNNGAEDRTYTYTSFREGTCSEN